MSSSSGFSRRTLITIAIAVAVHVFAMRRLTLFQQLTHIWPFETFEAQDPRRDHLRDGVFLPGPACCSSCLQQTEKTGSSNSYTTSAQAESISRSSFFCRPRSVNTCVFFKRPGPKSATCFRSVVSPEFLQKLPLTFSVELFEPV